MASYRYTRDIQPQDTAPASQAPAPMTRRQKWDNFWFYHKWHVVAAVVAALLVAGFVKEIVSQVEPDYQFGILTHQSVPSEVTEALAEALTPLCGDRNGDGRVYVQVLAYEFNDNIPQGVMAATTRLASDMQVGESAFFFCDDPAAFAREGRNVFAANDGSELAEEPDSETLAALGVDWDDCPVLQQLELPPLETGYGTIDVAGMMRGYKVVRRTLGGYKWNEEEQAYFQDADAMYRSWCGLEDGQGGEP